MTPPNFVWKILIELSYSMLMLSNLKFVSLTFPFPKESRKFEINLYVVFGIYVYIYFINIYLTLLRRVTVAGAAGTIIRFPKYFFSRKQIKKSLEILTKYSH